MYILVLINEYCDSTLQEHWYVCNFAKVVNDQTNWEMLGHIRRTWPGKTVNDQATGSTCSCGQTEPCHIHWGEPYYLSLIVHIFTPETFTVHLQTKLVSRACQPVPIHFVLELVKGTDAPSCCLATHMAKIRCIEMWSEQNTLISWSSNVLSAHILPTAQSH